MQVGEVVRFGDAGVSQFRVIDIDDIGARIEPTSHAPSGYPFWMPLAHLRVWTD